MLLIASALVAATMGEDAGRRFFGAYPSEAARNDRSAAAEFELTITPGGKLEKCALLRAVGDERLGAQTCEIVNRARFRFTPGSAPDGTPAYGVIHTSGKLFVPDIASGRAIRDHDFGPELNVAVRELPKGAGDRADLKVVAFIGADGKATTCEAAAGASAALAEIACLGVRTREWGVVVDPAGDAVPYVREFDVRLAIEREPSPA